MNPAEEVIEVLEKIEAAVEELQRVINSTLALVPDVMGWIVDRVKEGWDALMAKLAEFWAWFVDKLSYVGDPLALKAASSSWKTDIAGTTGNLARDIDDSDILVDDNWKGRAAEQYRQSIPPQREALDSIKADFAMKISDALGNLHAAILGFWVATVTAIFVIIGGFITATGAAVTVFGLPLAPPAALVGLGIGLATIGGAVLTLVITATGAKSTMEESVMGIQSWPAFVTA